MLALAFEGGAACADGSGNASHEAASPNGFVATFAPTAALVIGTATGADTAGAAVADADRERVPKGFPAGARGGSAGGGGEATAAASLPPRSALKSAPNGLAARRCFAGAAAGTSPLRNDESDADGAAASSGSAAAKRPDVVAPRAAAATPDDVGAVADDGAWKGILSPASRASRTREIQDARRSPDCAASLLSLPIAVS